MYFDSRADAGKKLASVLIKYRNDKPVVLTLPRGGVAVGYEIAEVLHAPLETVVVRKISSSSNPEFAIGAVAEKGVKILDKTTIDSLGINEKDIKNTLKLEREELKRRVKVYRNGAALPGLKGRLVILVDDGIATGLTAKAAIEVVKKLNPKKIILASPVCAGDTADNLKSKVDKVICLFSPSQFSAVGIWYKNFDQLSDSEVIRLLNKSQRLTKRSG